MEASPHRNRTLMLCTILHGFTHVYQVALIPLYLMIKKDLHLLQDSKVTLLLTLMGVAYFLPSFPVGVLADKVSRRKLLAFGLALNALGFICLGLSSSYGGALVSVVIAGMGGSFFHPAATGLVASLYPEATGKALGRVGMGAGVGFCFGPLFCGWRGEMAGWREPILELGIAGVVMAILFFFLSEEHMIVQKKGTEAHRVIPSSAYLFLFLGAAISFSLRDFAGNGMSTLASLFLQRVHGLDAQKTGTMISAVFLASIISNPLFGSLSDKGRLRWTAAALVSAAATVVLFPRMPFEMLVPILAAYGFFFMASYPMVEAALMETVDNTIRGRVFGFFITVGGCLGNIAHWAAGKWSSQLGAAANRPESYYPIYYLFAALILMSLTGLVFLKGLQKHAAIKTNPG
ncbi:MAG: Major facilitator superfamily 1 [Verrucomicrobiales bacterium]|nr:Major facilitator superfamily 1 [Verrucomicrobiales bacterium]